MEVNKPDDLVDFHPKTDLGKGRVPVGRQLGFYFVKSSLSSLRVIALLVTPKSGIVSEGILKLKTEKISSYKQEENEKAKMWQNLQRN